MAYSLRSLSHNIRTWNNGYGKNTSKKELVRT